MLRSPQLWLGLIAPLVVFLANLRPVWDYTVDDAFISFRFARNLANGDGLVYNLGQRVEGFTNLLWTLGLAGAIRGGLSVELTAKLLGASCGVGAIVGTYLLGRRLSATAPPLAPWLLATSITSTMFAVSGLETSLCTLLLVVLALALVDEGERPRAWPISGVVLAVAVLVRPEMPLFGGLLILLIRGVPRARYDWQRLVLPLLALLILLVFRRSYFGAWLPNTALAKITWSVSSLRSGGRYVGSFLAASLPVALLAGVGALVALVGRARSQLALLGIAATVVLVALAVGGDWMAGWRFLAPGEPFYYLLAESGAAWLFVARGRRIAVLAVVAIGSIAAWRVTSLRAQQREIVLVDEAAWDRAVAPLARWLAAQPRGTIAVGDIGRIGWVTDFPIYDYTGLVEPKVARARHADRADRRDPLRRLFVAAQPAYLVYPGADATCAVPISSYRDLLDVRGFRLVKTFGGGRESTWCVLLAGSREGPTGLDER